jgi:hypothetical protein
MNARSRRRSFTTLVAGFGLAVSLVATVVPTVSGAGSGCSVSNGPVKYSDLQSAIDQAAARSTLVVAGTCRPLVGGPFLVTRSISLSGDGATLAGTPTSTDFGPKLNPVLTVRAGTTVSISGLTISGGKVGIENAGNLTIENATITGNAAGGIANSGTLALKGVTVSDTGGDAPGIVNTGTASLTGSTVSGNSSTAEGGGIRNDGTLTLTGSTVSGNSSAYHGGGIFNRGVLSLTATSVTANSAQGGGGIWNDFIVSVCIAPAMTVTANSPNQVIGNYVVAATCP